MGMKARARWETLDEYLLAQLRHEYGPERQEAVEGRIRRGLRRYGHGLDEGMSRIHELRTFKNALLEHVSRPMESDYYVRAPEERGFARMTDFDVARLQTDLAAAHPSIDRGLLAAFVTEAIYLYYLR